MKLTKTKIVDDGWIECSFEHNGKTGKFTYICFGDIQTRGIDNVDSLEDDDEDIYAEIQDVVEEWFEIIQSVRKRTKEEVMIERL